ncbi:MAG: MOSC domain-containing protein [Actinobacteria bacterium]|nr:MOSC domain-containing protein [Actinomycetota bacterium]
MHVTELWQYPVKSMIGSRLPEAHFTELGMVGDRIWALRDVDGDYLANTRQTPGIMQLAAAHGGGGDVAIRLADGRSVLSSDSEANAVLSEALGRSVRLESLRPPEDLDFYRSRGELPEDLMGYLRDIFAREDDEPLPDFSKFGPYVGEYQAPPGTFYDCYPLLLMTTSSLRTMAAALPDSVVDVRRFRPTLVIDTGDEPGHPEFEWSGRQFSIGSVVVEVVNDCPRCAAITKQVTPDIPQDRAILRHVVKEMGQAVGAYAKVVQPGTITQGDEVRART